MQAVADYIRYYNLERNHSPVEIRIWPTCSGIRIT
ncbi:TPA: hypothetical protein ACP61A_004742 [Escherichia coli]